MRAIDFIKETRAELRHVSWPTRRQTIAFTILVVAISVVVAVYLGALDYLFTYLLRLVIGA